MWTVLGIVGVEGSLAIEEAGDTYRSGWALWCGRAVALLAVRLLLRVALLWVTALLRITTLLGIASLLRVASLL